jgi:hypothetical protein
MHATLIGTYELGRQPFGLASPAAWLAAEGWQVTCIDLAVEQLDENAVAGADFVALHMPMHTATRLGAELLPRLKALNSSAHYCAFGLYAPMNEGFLRSLGINSVLGGESEASLVSVARRVEHDGGTAAGEQIEPVISLERLAFRLPDRTGLPPLERYAKISIPGEGLRTVGYTEASRGCKHTCRHCPVVPVYGGRFRVVPAETILADVQQQVEAGAQHLTFGDPDFLNAPGHAFPLVTEMHRRFPDLTYDATIKVEHLLHHAEKLQQLSDTGCLFVTTAVEAVDDDILRRFDKNHTRADFIDVVARCSDVGLTLNPTFVTFTPWTSLEGYLDLLTLIQELGLVTHVSPIQYSIRLLVPEGSLLLDLPDMAQYLDGYDAQSLAYPWAHPDPRVDDLYRNVLGAVVDADTEQQSRTETFQRVRTLARKACGVPDPEDHVGSREPSHAIPHLTEPWYCCAEPTDLQLAAMKPQL